MVVSATLAVVNARVYTVDSERSWAEAIAVKGDRIVYVGSEDGIEDYLGPDTRVIDAEGRLVLPGFVDSHVHASHAYLVAYWANLDDAPSFDEIARRMRTHAQEHPDDEIVGGVGWTYDAMASRGRFPSKTDLDEVVSGRPLLMISYDGWVVLANSMMTRMVENALDRSSKTAGAVRDAESGELTGMFKDPGDLMYHAGPLTAKIRQRELEGMRWVFAQFPRYGITSVQEAETDFRSLDAFRALRESGGLTARVYVALGHHKGMSDEELNEYAKRKAAYSDDWIRLGAVKFYIDGVMEARTAALIDPYADDLSTRGETRYEPGEFNEAVMQVDALGFQCWTHACGDRGVKVALDAYEHALRQNSRRDSRHRVEHVELVSERDIPRFRELGVIASMQPLHAMPVMNQSLANAIGPARMRMSFLWKNLDDAGARLAFSSDWSVADMNPLLGIHGAVTRGDELGASQSVSLEKSIEAYTLNGAYASFEEDVKGSIEVGKLADFVILSANLFEIAPSDIADVEVLLTVVGGGETYRSPDL